jgi:hypothetical protein
MGCVTFTVAQDFLVKPGDLFEAKIDVTVWRNPTPSILGIRQRLLEGDVVVFLGEIRANYYKSLTRFGVCYVYEGYYTEFFEKLLP